MKARIENTINKLTSVEFTDCALFGCSFSLSPVHRAQVYKLYVKPDHSKIRNYIQDHPPPWKMACWWCKIVWAGWFTSSFLQKKEAGFLVEGFRIEQPRRIRLWRRTSSTHSNKANYPGNEAEIEFLRETNLTGIWLYLTSKSSTQDMHDDFWH